MRRLREKDAEKNLLVGLICAVALLVAMMFCESCPRRPIPPPVTDGSQQILELPAQR